MLRRKEVAAAAAVVVAEEDFVAEAVVAAGRCKGQRRNVQCKGHSSDLLNGPQWIEATLGAATGPWTEVTLAAETGKETSAAIGKSIVIQIDKLVTGTWDARVISAKEILTKPTSVMLT